MNKLLIAAVVGGAAVLLIASAAGWLYTGTTKTVVVRAPAPTAGDATAPVVAAKPLVGNGFQPAQIYRTRAAGVVTVISYFDAANLPDARAGQGSGFVVSKDGPGRTKAHVITTAGQGPGNTTTARTVYVEFADGDRVTAKVVGADLFDDVGVVRIDPHQHALDPVPLGDSSRIVVGQPVAAIGSPFGNADSLSVGVISVTIVRFNPLWRCIRDDAAVAACSASPLGNCNAVMRSVRSSVLPGRPALPASITST